MPNEMPTLEIGDVVRLKSGGNKMTVAGESSGFGKAKMVTCVWHAGSKPEMKSYPVAALKRVPAEAEKSTYTEGEIAAWMVKQLEQSDCLYETEVVDYLSDKFGEEGTYANSNGNLAIAEPILAEFNNLTGDNAVWVRSDRYWRKRQPDDPPGRQQ